MSRKIQEGSFIYFFTKFFVDLSLRSAYRKYQVEGAENIPTDGSVIWASNHTNALMDPLVLLAATSGQKVFMARADIFQKKKAVKWLSFLKIMPIYRIRDGFESVKRNTETIAQATEILLDGVPLVIYPEATHRPKHSLLKLSKGIFHITSSVYENSPADKPVYIQPIGIEYGDYFRFRSTVLVRFGKPIDVSEYIRSHGDIPVPVQMLELKKILSDRLAGLIAFVPDDESYDATWEYAKLKAGNPEYSRKVISELESDGNRLPGLMRRQAVDRYAIGQVSEMKKTDPEGTAELLRKVEDLRVWRIQNGVSVRTIAKSCTFAGALLKAVLALVGLPYYIFCAVVASIFWIPTLLILRGIKDEAFYNTARFGVRFGISIIAVPLWAVLYFCFLPSWPLALGALVLSLPSIRYLYDYGDFFRRTASDLRWVLRRRKAPDYSFL